MSALWMKMTAFLLLFLMPMAMMSANVAGLVHVSGNDARLDGQPCHDVVVGFEGERLSTGGNSKATVTSRGTVISISSNTSVKLGAKALELLQGAVVVSSDAGTSTQVENVTISTSPGVHSKFLAQRVNDELQLLALEGKVELSDEQETGAVPAAKGVKLKIGKDSKRSGDSGRPRSRWAWLSNDDIGILIVIAAGIAAGVTLGIVNSHKDPVSSQ